MVWCDALLRGFWYKIGSKRMDLGDMEQVWMTSFGQGLLDPLLDLPATSDSISIVPDTVFRRRPPSVFGLCASPTILKYLLLYDTR